MFVCAHPPPPLSGSWPLSLQEVLVPVSGGNQGVKEGSVPLTREVSFWIILSEHAYLKQACVCVRVCFV